MANETVDVTLDGTRVATIALRSIIAVYPNTILVNVMRGMCGKSHDVITIVIDGSRDFHVDPSEGERVRRLWKEWTRR